MFKYAASDVQEFTRPEDSLLRAVDPRTGEYIPSLEEAVEMAEQEAQRAATAEAEVARLRRLLDQASQRNS